MRNRAFLLVLIMSISVLAWKLDPGVFATPASYTLYGSSTEGWGFEPTSQNMTIPGPDLRASQGETVQLTLTAVSEPDTTFVHDFGIDYDGDISPSAGEPHSEYFGGGLPDTITYTFLANAAPGTYTYYCYIHSSMMFGRFITTVSGAPVASFSYTPASPSVNEAITFDASSSFDPDGTITSYDWWFGDGVIGSGVIVQHTYLNPGTYTTTLTVTDDTGLTNVTSRSVNVTGPGNSAPIASFTFAPTMPILGQAVNFNASGSSDPDPGDRVTSYSWDFGDGTILAGQVQPLASHIYRTFGNLSASLAVTDSQGVSNQNSKPIIVLPIRNVAVTGLVVTPTYVKASMRVTIDVTARNMGNETEIFQIRLRWNSTEIMSWPATAEAGEHIAKSYDWTVPSPGVFIISAKILVSSDDQNPEDDEKTVSLTAEGTQGLPGIFYWSLAGAGVATTGLAFYVYRRRRVAVPSDRELGSKSSASKATGLDRAVSQPLRSSRCDRRVLLPSRGPGRVLP